MTTTEVSATSKNGVDEYDLSYLEIENKIVRFDMPWVRGDGVHLLVKTATNENTEFNEASLRMGGQRRRDIIEGGASLTSDNAKEDREEDRILYPKYIIVGWGGIRKKINRDGKIEVVDVPFSRDECAKFIKVLPGWIFDKLRMFCMRPEKFLDPDDLQEQREPDAVVVAGN